MSKEITAQTLGRYRAELSTVREATADVLESMGFVNVEEAVTATYKSLAIRAGVTVEDLTERIDALTSRSSGGGVREADKVTRDTLITETQDALAPLNLAINSHRGLVVLTTQQKARAFDQQGKTGDALATHLLKSFPPVGGMSMVWNPRCQNPTSDDGLGVYVGGWEDGSKNLRFQYSPRKCPVSKRSGYRDDSFQVPMLDIGKPVEQPQQEKSEQSPPDAVADAES